LKAVIQRVKYAIVKVENEIKGEIKNGLFILFGVEKNDTEEKLEYFVKKTANLRIFSDETGKMNLSVQDIKGSILVVSQFTLAADCKKGLRPSFDNAMEPNRAEKIYEEFVSMLKRTGLNIQTGVFGAHMEIS